MLHDVDGYFLESLIPLIECNIPVRTNSRANARGHWSKHSGLYKEQRGVSEICFRRFVSNLEAEFPITIVMTRIAPGVLDDDNLQTALKSVRDGIADAIGLPGHDADPQLIWRYHQIKQRGYSVRVQVYESIPL